MFDPVAYWKRRKDGKRGQGDPIQPVKVEDAKQGEHMVRTRKGIEMVNRKTARQKQPSDPSYTKRRKKNGR